MYSLGYVSGWEVPFGSFFCIGQPLSVYCGGLGSLFLFNILLSLFIKKENVVACLIGRQDVVRGYSHVERVISP